MGNASVKEARDVAAAVVNRRSMQLDGARQAKRVECAPMRSLDHFWSKATFTAPHPTRPIPTNGGRTNSKFGERFWRNMNYFQTNYMALIAVAAFLNCFIISYWSIVKVAVFFVLLSVGQAANTGDVNLGGILRRTHLDAAVWFIRVIVLRAAAITGPFLPSGTPDESGLVVAAALWALAAVQILAWVLGLWVLALAPGLAIAHAVQCRPPSKAKIAGHAAALKAAVNAAPEATTPFLVFGCVVSGLFEEDKKEMLRGGFRKKE
jgi:hypothetical protein